MAKQPTEIEILNAEISDLRAQLASKPVPVYVANPTACDLHEYTDGEFKDSATSEVFQLKITARDDYGNTHFLKNKERYWQGTKEQFRAKFEKQ